MWAEGGDIIQLETTDFQHIIFLWLFSYHTGKAMTYIPSYPYRETCLLQKVIQQACGSRFSVTPCDSNDFCIGIAGSKFYLGDNLYPFLFGVLDNGHLVWYAWTFDNTVSRENLTLCMLTFFPAYPRRHKFFFVNVLQR